LQRLANPANPYPKKPLVGKSIPVESDTQKAEADYELWKIANGAKPETERPKAEAPPIELLKRLAEPEKAGKKTDGEDEPKAKSKTAARSDFSLRTLSFKDARTPFERSMAAFRTLGVSFSYDKFRNQLLVGGHALKQLVGESIEHHILLLRSEVNNRYGWEAKREVTKAAVVRLCLERSFNPVLDYLDGLVWDGKRRLDTWLSVYLGASNDRLNRAIGRKTLLAAVRRAREPGTKFDQVVVFEGVQGTGKARRSNSRQRRLFLRCRNPWAERARGHGANNRSLALRDQRA
jgi:Virulence-associated protein E-like domain